MVFHHLRLLGEQLVLFLDELAAFFNELGLLLHQAALPSVPKSVADPMGTNAVNVNGTLNLLVAARDATALAPLYQALGLKVAAARPAEPTAQRRDVWAADVAYTAARVVRPNEWIALGLPWCSLM